MTLAANPYRGEISVTLEGVAYTLRPSFEAIVEIEQKLGTSIVAVVNRAFKQEDVRVTDMGVIVAAGIRAHGREVEDKSLANVSDQKIAQLCWAEGLTAIIPPVAEFLLLAINGGKSGNGESGAADAA